MRTGPALLLLGSLAATTACTTKKTEDESRSRAGTLASPEEEIAAPITPSQVRLLNAMPAAPQATVSAGERALFQDVRFRSVTPYQSMSQRTEWLRLRTPSRDTTLATDNRLAIDGSHYTVIARTMPDGSPRLDVVRDRFTEDTLHAQMRIVDAMADNRPIDVFVSRRTIPLYDNLRPGHVVELVTLDPGRTTITVKTDEKARQLLQQSIDLKAGHVYTGVITGVPTGRMELLLVDDHVASAPAPGPVAPTRDTTRRFR